MRKENGGSLRVGWHNGLPAGMTLWVRTMARGFGERGLRLECTCGPHDVRASYLVLESKSSEREGSVTWS